MASPLLEQTKVQADVLVPLLRAFRSAIGEEEANRIAWHALAGWRKEVVARLTEEVSAEPGVARWAAGMRAGQPQIGDAVTIDDTTASGDRYAFDVTVCQFAAFFRQLGEPELGFALLCAMDTDATDGLGGGDVALDRPTTIMEGGDRCRFRYDLKAAGHSTT